MSESLNHTRLWVHTPDGEVTFVGCVADVYVLSGMLYADTHSAPDVIATQDVWAEGAWSRYRTESDEEDS